MTTIRQHFLNHSALIWVSTAFIFLPTRGTIGPYSLDLQISTIL